MRKYNLIPALTTAVLFATAPALGWNVFGNDPREEVEASDGRYPYPFEAIGRADNGCTVSLVGNRLALTAAHCVVDSASGNVRNDLHEVEIDLIHGKAREKARVTKAWIGTFSPVDTRVRDWAILLLDRKIDGQIRRLKLKAVDYSQMSFPQSTSLAGFSGDKGAGRHLTAVTECTLRELTKKKDCDGKEVQDGLLFHDCASTTGISGAPMMGYDSDDAFIESIAVSERRKGPVSVFRDNYTCEYANIAIGVSATVPVLNKLLRTVDLGLKAPKKIDGAFEVTVGETLPSPSPTPDPDCDLLPPSKSDGENSVAQGRKIAAHFERDSPAGSINVDAFGWSPGRCYGEQSYAALMVGMGVNAQPPLGSFYLLLNISAAPSYFDALSASVQDNVRAVVQSLKPRVETLETSGKFLSARFIDDAGEWGVKQIACGKKRYFIAHVSQGPATWCYYESPAH